jgi:hypothetical protein
MRRPSAALQPIMQGDEYPQFSPPVHLAPVVEAVEAEFDALDAASLPFDGPGSVPAMVAVETQAAIREVNAAVAGLDAASLPFDGPGSVPAMVAIETQAAIREVNAAVAGLPAQTIEVLAQATGEPTGWVDRSEATISTYVGLADQGVTITPVGPGGFRVYLQGVPHTFTAPVTVPFSGAEGWHYVWFNGAGWQEDTVFPTANFEQVVLTCFAHFNADTRVFTRLNDERHGVQMDGITHRYLHLTRGTQYLSGFGVTATVDASNTVPASDEQSRVAVAGGAFADEDIIGHVVHKAAPAAPFEQDLGTGLTAADAALLPVFYLDGTGKLRRHDPDGNRWAFKPGATYPQYNRLLGGVWGLAEPGSDQRIVYWVCVTNSLESPVFLLMGQGAYASLTAARAVGPGAIAWGDSPFAEILVLFRIVYRVRVNYTNATYRAKVEALDASPGNVLSVASVQSHSSLAGLAFTQSGHTGFQRGAYLGLVVPTPDNDGVDTASIGRTFASGDTWVDTVTRQTYRCISAATAAAVWEGSAHAQLGLAAAADVLLVTAGTAQKVPGLADGSSLNFEAGDSQLTHRFYQGCYHFTGAADVSVDKACTLTLELRKNGNPTGLRSPHTFTASAKKEVLAITRLVDFVRDDVFTVWAESDTDNTTVTFSTLNVVFSRC